MSATLTTVSTPGKVQQMKSYGIDLLLARWTRSFAWEKRGAEKQAE